MKVMYVANNRIPTEKAHGIQIVKTCEALVKSGVDLTLVVPRRLNPRKEDVFEYYDVKKKFTVARLWIIDTVKFGKLGYWFEYFTFLKSLFYYLLIHKSDCVYTREAHVIVFLSFFYRKKKYIWESHNGKDGRVAQKALKKIDHLVVITKGLKDFYVTQGVPAGKMVVAPDAVELSGYNDQVTKEDCRSKLDLPHDKKLIVYTGQLYERKGVNVLVHITSTLPEDTVLVIAGPDGPDLDNLRKLHSHEKILYRGGLLPKDAILYQKAADILVLPNLDSDTESAVYTSPMKLFEYMASGVPIVASDVPAIREVLDESMAYFFSHTKSNFSEVVHTALEDKESEAKSNKAKEEVKKYTWEKRAESIKVVFE